MAYGQFCLAKSAKTDTDRAVSRTFLEIDEVNVQIAVRKQNYLERTLKNT